MNIVPSKFQSAIFDFIAKSTQSLLIEAVAGSGKTTTIIKCLELLFKLFGDKLSILFLAFNKSIAEELTKRFIALGINVQAKTFHSICFGAIRKSGISPKIEQGKSRLILRNWLSERDAELYATFACKAVGFAKNNGVGYLCGDTEEVWRALIERNDLELDHEDADEFTAIQISRELLHRSNACASEMIDFDDMLYIALIRNLTFWRNDYVFVDESQDTNPVQQALLKRMLKVNGRLIAVGDSYQAIYGFRGADSSAMANIRDEFQCATLPLSVSYRCAQSVVSAAQQIVPQIEWSESAPVGVVSALEFGGGQNGWSYSDFRDSDVIICRNTRPLVAMCYALIKQRIPCKILGRDIGQGLITLIEKRKAKGIDALEAKLAKYMEREKAKYQSKFQDAKAQAVEDKVESIFMFISMLDEGNRSVPGLIALINSMFSDNGKQMLTLCTAHKSKGLEWDRVFILDRDKYMPSKYARQEWQKVQEMNLLYVATTRAKQELYYISTPDEET